MAKRSFFRIHVSVFVSRIPRSVWESNKHKLEFAPNNPTKKGLARLAYKLQLGSLCLFLLNELNIRKERLGGWLSYQTMAILGCIKFQAACNAAWLKNDTTYTCRYTHTLRVYDSPVVHKFCLVSRLVHLLQYSQDEIQSMHPSNRMNPPVIQLPIPGNVYIIALITNCTMFPCSKAEKSCLSLQSPEVLPWYDVRHVQDVLPQRSGRFGACQN